MKKKSIIFQKKLSWKMFAVLGSVALTPVLVQAQPVRFAYDSAVHKWGVPAGVLKLTISASGGIGGGGVGSGGYSASFTGVCSVTPGDSLALAVAGMGGTSVNYDGEGGGGATFVYDSNNLTLLMVAAGGGGASYGPGNAGGNGGIDLIGNTGNPGSGPVGDAADGTGGNGGSGGINVGYYGAGGGGAGWFSNGANAMVQDTSYGGLDRANHFFGGTYPYGPSPDSNRGGYGGGSGGGYDAGGGGGGYNGGGGGNDDGTGNGGDGGGSYLNGVLIGTAQDTGTANGWAVISYIALNVAHNNTCAGSSNGSASANPTGGTGVYTYSWNPGGLTSDTITGLSAGIYTLTVMDSVGDKDSVTIAISTKPLPSVTFTGNDSVCKGDSSIITANGGTSYLWSTGATTSSIRVLTLVDSTFSVSVGGSDTCTKDTSITIKINPVPTLTLQAANDTTCPSVTTDLLTGIPAGGTFSGTGVTGNNFNPNVAGLGTHTITYTYTNGHGCTNSDSIKVAVTTGACLGINEVDTKGNAVELYPNPFSQSINIIINQPGTATVTMYNMVGQAVGTWQMEQGQHLIDAQSIPEGVYMMQVKSVNGLLINTKLVKMN